MMKKYEGLFILKPNLTEDEFGKLSTAAAEVIIKNGGKVDRKEDMGVRDMAYQIKKEKKGRYLLVYFTVEPKAVSAIEKAYRLNESVLRSVVFEHE